VPPSEPQPPSPFAAASCRGPGMPVPRARHGHAAALEGQDPCACTPTPWGRTLPSLAALPSGRPRPSLAMPRHDPATALLCAVTTRHRRDVAFVSRPALWGFYSSTLRAPVRTRTHTPLPAALGPDAVAPDPTEADTWDRPVGVKERRRKEAAQPRPGPRSNAARRQASRAEFEAHVGLLGRAGPQRVARP
jgi:hypothetical protein